MPWHEVNTMSLRREFVHLASEPGANIAQLTRRFAISRTCGYKWLTRFRAEGEAGLRERSRRPHTSPRQTPPAVEAAVVELRQADPAWGGRKLAVLLAEKGIAPVPAPSTITGILRRHRELDPQVSAEHQRWQRFEHPTPNALWQMDFKGHFPTLTERCHPLTVLDDHSRYALVLHACPDERTATVQGALIPAFRRYGLPAAILTDHGSPWGDDADSPYTRLGVWLLRLGIEVWHGHPYHPQTQGKDERFHGTLQRELLRDRLFVDLADCQRAFDAWRERYNTVRPHESLGQQRPAYRYQLSPRPYPEVLPTIDYAVGALVRRVQLGGHLSFQGRQLHVPKAFVGQPVAVRPLERDGWVVVYFSSYPIAEIELTTCPKAS